MGRAIRIIEPQRLYFVTNRTQQGRLLLAPSREVNDLIGGVLGRALSLFEVEIFAFVFMSNHFHLIVRANEGQLSPFMSHLQGNIARELGRLIHWRGAFWERRYSAEPILDDESYESRLAYLLSHGVKEGLVEKARQWPGLSCLPELTGSSPRSFPWIHRAELCRRREKKPELCERSCTTLYPVPLSVAPAWARMSQDLRCERVKSLVRDGEKKASEQRAGRAVLGVKHLRRQRPHHRPRQVKRSRRPLCHAATRSARQEYRQLYLRTVAVYRDCSHRFRSGEFGIEFPKYCYRPPLHYSSERPT
ncbi:MAG: transposase [Pseudomonadota bacterium]